MNKSILITGANAGLGKESARQLGLLKATQKVILGCRNPQKAEAAKKELEEQTGRKIFEILIMDVSNEKSVKEAVSKLSEPVDALIMNAGGIGGKTPEAKLANGMNHLSAHNLLGHVVLVEELIKSKKLLKVAMLASSEAARGIDKMGMKQPSLKTNSVEELSSVLDGSYFGKKFDPMQAYGHVKYVGTLWMSALARKYPEIKFLSMSPGATSGTAITGNAPAFVRFMFKYIMMPIVMPLRGMVHKVDKGAARYVDAINNDKYPTGSFYASSVDKVVGQVEDQFKIFPTLANESYQDNAYKAIHNFVN